MSALPIGPVTFSHARAFIDVITGQEPLGGEESRPRSPLVEAHLAAVFGIDGVASTNDVWVAHVGTTPRDAPPVVKVARLAAYLRAVADAIAPPASVGKECSFCHKALREVKALIAGHDSHICDECLGLCNEILTTREAERAVTAAMVAKRGAPVGDAVLVPGTQVIVAWPNGKPDELCQVIACDPGRVEVVCSRGRGDAYVTRARVFFLPEGASPRDFLGAP